MGSTRYCEKSFSGLQFHVKFEWDETKSDACFSARGFDFRCATAVFRNPFRKVAADDRVDYGERRYRITGRIGGHVFVVVCTIRSARYRLISARRASRKEAEAYGSG